MGKKIALFTPFHPLTGGGGTIFRSILTQLAEGECQWFYLSNTRVDYPESTWLGLNLLGGSLFQDALRSSMLYCLKQHPSILKYAREILKWSPEVCWVNAMNEGLLIGNALLRLGVPKLHVSVHDDPSGLAIKSRRYRHLSKIIDGCNRSLLQHADSVDVVSEPMKAYYRERYRIDSSVVFRYFDYADVPRTSFSRRRPESAEVILVGHVGSVYSEPEIRAFLRALSLVGNRDGVQFRVIAFGKSPHLAKAVSDFPELVEFAGDVPEPEVVMRLQECRFVYSMYSFDSRHRIFRETSQPTKLSTYLMAARPIFAHCPEGSSTIHLMSKFKLGVCISSLEEERLAAGIRSILGFNLDPFEVQNAAEFYCGRRNLTNLATSLGLCQFSNSAG